MNRVFQPSINAATQELVEEGLKSMMEHPKNNELIDKYREMKRKMAEAEARQAVDELVKEVMGCQPYKTWLAKELKKDERRSKKRMPSDDLQRVKLYIAQLKSSLPAVIPTIAYFIVSKDNWGREGMWRVQSNGYLSGLAVLDGDHVPNPEERIEEWLKREDFKDLGILWIFITPSGEGIKVIFKAREDWGNLQDNAYTMAEKLGILDYADGQTKGEKKYTKYTKRLQRHTLAERTVPFVYSGRNARGVLAGRRSFYQGAERALRSKSASSHQARHDADGDESLAVLLQRQRPSESHRYGQAP